MAGLLDLMAPDPNIVSRGSFYPYGYDKTGRGQMTYPGLLIDAAKSFDNLGTAMRLPANAPVTHPAYKSVFDAAGTISLPSLLSPARPSSTVGMNLYHGGPNKWKPEPGYPQGRPRLDKMGSGEGNQAYGHGFYSAEKRAVADDYKKLLSPIAPSMTYSGKPIAGGITMAGATRKGTDFTPQEGMANVIYNQAIKEGLDPAVVIQNNINSVLKRKNNTIERAKAEGREGRSQHIVEVQNLDNHIGLLKSIDPKLMRKAGPNDKVPEGQLYKIDIPDEDIAKYIDLDAPLTQQREIIEKLKTVVNNPDDPNNPYTYEIIKQIDEALKNPNATGEKILEILGNDKISSEFLTKLGIPGNRYFDQMSRGKYGVQLKYKGKDYTDGPVEFATKKQADDYLKESTEKGFEAEHIDIGTRNYVTWDQDVLDRVKVLQRNKNKYQQEINSGVPFI